MCYHKSLVAKYESLAEHYTASFAAVNEERVTYKERFTILMSRDNRAEPYRPEEVAELKWLEKAISAFTDTGYRRYHENGFDFLPAPVITAGAPEEFKLFRWGLIPYYMSDAAKAMTLRASTLNCISEEMYEKPSFRDAAKNAQRCLIPVTGFYEWQWKDEKGKTKIPYFISVKDQPLLSMAGIYSRWKDRSTGTYYYSYAVLTTRANPFMEQIHNSKKRMPVIIPFEYEKDWLNKELSKEDVLALCEPFSNDRMKAHTISKLITTKNAETNVEDVMKAYAYDEG